MKEVSSTGIWFSPTIGKIGIGPSSGTTASVESHDHYRTYEAWMEGRQYGLVSGITLTLVVEAVLLLIVATISLARRRKSNSWE